MSFSLSLLVLRIIQPEQWSSNNLIIYFWDYVFGTSSLWFLLLLLMITRCCWYQQLLCWLDELSIVCILLSSIFLFCLLFWLNSINVSVSHILYMINHTSFWSYSLRDFSKQTKIHWLEHLKSWRRIHF